MGVGGDAQMLNRLRQEFFPAKDQFDRERGVSTYGLSTLWYHRVLAGKWNESVRYQAVDENLFRSAVEGVPRWTFVDLGCGRGRALILAHEAGFPKIIGVDFSAPLCRTARKNLKKLGIASNIVHSDVRTFLLPPERCVVFLYNPFGAETLRSVISRFDANAKVIVYVNPIHDQVLEFPVINRGDRFAVYQCNSLAMGSEIQP
jgi:SAM-dependent methyltransferase